MLLELIAIGGCIFWALAILAFVIEFIAVGNEKACPTILVPIVFVAIMSFFSSWSLPLFFKENWLNMLWSLLAYVIIACIYAMLKWYRRSIRRGIIYANCLEDWAEENMPEGVKITSVNHIPMDKRLAFFNKLKDAFYKGTQDESYGRERWDIPELSRDPNYYRDDSAIDKQNKEKEHILKAQKQVLRKVLSSPKENKERITVWMAAWPISILTTFVFDFLYDFFGWLRKSLTGMFVEISRIGLGKYRKDFDSIKVEKEI